MVVGLCCCGGGDVAVGLVCAAGAVVVVVMRGEPGDWVEALGEVAAELVVETVLLGLT